MLTRDPNQAVFACFRGRYITRSTSSGAGFLGGGSQGEGEGEGSRPLLVDVDGSELLAVLLHRGEVDTELGFGLRR